MVDSSPVSLRRTRIDPSAFPDGSVLVDNRRERTRWSEGMFVTAQHFNRDQSYLITRAGDFGEAIGAGVIEGLEVTSPVDEPTVLVVQPGLGIAGGGESIVVHKPVRIPLADIALQKDLVRATGIENKVQLMAESRSGLFVLCATPVEFNSNPVGSYATTPGGERTLEDSVVNEATLFTLIPWSLAGTADSAEQRRAAAAKRLFVDGQGPDIPTVSLPLAMVEVEGNLLTWLDMHLIRRDAGLARADAFGLGFVDTPRRVSHFRQYDSMIAELVGASPGLAFSAADRFEVLPPMGRLPAACIKPRAPAPGLAPVLSHNWLPSEVPVELVALPEDEIDQLLEESLTMPPLDLSANVEALAQTPVSIIVPVSREQWNATPAEIIQKGLTLSAAKPLGGTAQTPMALIRELIDQADDPDLLDPTVSAEWRALLAGRTFLWYSRRRQFLRTDALTGEAFRFPSDDSIPGDVPAVEEPAIEEPTIVDPNVEDPTVEDPPIEDPLIAVGPILDIAEDAVRSGVSAWGMVPLYNDLQASSEDGGIRSNFAATLGLAIANESPLIATDIMHQFNADASLATLGRLFATYSEPENARAIATHEVLLTGGLADIVVPSFTAELSAADVSGTTARAVNLGVSPQERENLDLPTDFDERLRIFLDNFASDEVSKMILLQGGGVVPLLEPRNTGLLAEMMNLANELALPLQWKQRDPGSIESQTRRNLVAHTLELSTLAEVAAQTSLLKFSGPLLELMQTIDTVLNRPVAQARRATARALQQLLQEIGL